MKVTPYSAEPETLKANYSIVLFDGVCNLCDATINFIIDHDKQNVFRFAALQSAIGQNMLKEKNITPDIQTIVLIQDGEVYLRSAAILHILKKMGLPWKLLFYFIVIPSRLRDRIYTLVSSNRYVWFNYKTQCRLLTPELREKFL